MLNEQLVEGHDHVVYLRVVSIVGGMEFGQSTLHPVYILLTANREQIAIWSYNGSNQALVIILDLYR